MRCPNQTWMQGGRRAIYLTLFLCYAKLVYFSLLSLQYLLLTFHSFTITAEPGLEISRHTHTFTS